jgi:hypothetical protein
MARPLHLRLLHARLAAFPGSRRQTGHRQQRYRWGVRAWPPHRVCATCQRHPLSADGQTTAQWAGLQGGCARRRRRRKWPANALPPRLQQCLCAQALGIGVRGATDEGGLPLLQRFSLLHGCSNLLLQLLQPPLQPVWLGHQGEFTSFACPL